MDSNTKSVVLKKFEQLLKLKHTGSTPKMYTHYVSNFLDFSKNVPDRVTNEDFLDYNIHINELSYSVQTIAISAVKAYFQLYLRKKVMKYADIRPKKPVRVPQVYDAEVTALKINAIPNTKHRSILSLGLSS